MSRESDIRRRYGEKEIGRILSLAVRLQEREGQATTAPETPEGFSLEELQQVAAEVGIEPRHLFAAARAFESEVAERTPLLGAPATWEIEHTFAGEASAAAWEEIVAAIRQSFGQPGSVGTVGRSYEWQGESGCSSVSLSRRDGATKIRVGLRNGGVLVLAYLFPTLAAIIAAGPLTEELLHLPALAEWAISGGIVGASWGLVRTVLGAWFRGKTRAVRKLMAQIEGVIEDHERAQTGATVGEPQTAEPIATDPLYAHQSG